MKLRGFLRRLLTPILWLFGVLLGPIRWLRSLKLRRIIRCLRSPDPSVRGGRPIPAQRRAFFTARALVRAYYAASFFILVTQCDNWAKWLKLDSILALWPVSWMPLVGVSTGVTILLIWNLVAMLVAVMWPHHRAVRFTMFLGVLQYGAFWNSFGNINHGWHLLTYIAFAFVFLPDGTLQAFEASRVKRQRYLTAFWAAQAFCVLGYSTSGAFKLAGAAIQIWRGETNAFSPDAFAHQIAYVLSLGTRNEGFSLLGPTIIEHPWWGWPMYLLTLYFEAFAFFAVFRPSAHRTWGMFLIFFHVGSILTLTIRFTWNIFLLALLLMGSPLAPERERFGDVLRSLPLIGDAWYWLGQWKQRQMSLAVTHKG